MNFQIFKLDLEKAEEPEIKLSTSIGSLKKKKVPEKHLLLLCSLCKTFECVDHTNCGKFFKRWENSSRSDHLTCLLRNLYAIKEATVRTGHGTTDWFQIRKGVCQGYILSPCLFNLYGEYIMWNAWLDESQTGIKTAGRNINNLRFADTTLMAESEKLKSPLMRVKESENSS